VSARDIDVSCSLGIVILSGFADTLFDKEYAVRLSQTIKDVRAVINQLKIRPASRNDQSVRRDVEEALHRDPATDIQEVKVHVREGIVALSGMVESWQEKQLCATVTKNVKGVVDVRNQISVEVMAKRPDDEIKSEIQRCLEFDVWLDASLINVQVRDGRVSLDGRVGHAEEKEHATSLAWIGGVTTVDAKGLAVDHTLRDSRQQSMDSMTQPDEAIRQAVEDTLISDTRIVSPDIEVSVVDGTVVLSGVVGNETSQKAVEENAWNTVGVNQVQNQLKISGQ
jgi:osmotically-inducible protein OsmY